MDIKTAQYCQDPLVAENSGIKVVTQTDDNLLVPLDNDNRDYQEVQDWVAKGGTIAPAAPAPATPVISEE